MLAVELMWVGIQILVGFKCRDDEDGGLTHSLIHSLPHHSRQVSGANDRKRGRHLSSGTWQCSPVGGLGSCLVLYRSTSTPWTWVGIWDLLGHVPLAILPGLEV